MNFTFQNIYSHQNFLLGVIVIAYKFVIKFYP